MPHCRPDNWYKRHFAEFWLPNISYLNLTNHRHRNVATVTSWSFWYFVSCATWVRLTSLIKHFVKLLSANKLKIYLHEKKFFCHTTQFDKLLILFRATHVGHNRFPTRNNMHSMVWQFTTWNRLRLPGWGPMLPDGIFAYKNPNFCIFFDGLGVENVGIFCRHLV
jgi:hypothetical protein